MSIPDAPQTRGEAYLNAIATGDSSGIPVAPQTREEQYLDAIAKNGGGGVLAVTATLVENNAKAATKALDGGGGGNAAQYRLDKTWQEIADADFAVIRVTYEEGGYEGTEITTVIGVGSMEGQYDIFASAAPDFSDTPDPAYTTDSADGYPVYTAS